MRKHFKIISIKNSYLFQATSEENIDITFIDYEWRLEKQISILTNQMESYPTKQNLNEISDKICPFASSELIQCIQDYLNIEKEKFYLRLVQLKSTIHHYVSFKYIRLFFDLS